MPRAGPDVLDFGSHCSAKFQPILDCFIPIFKLKYANSENIKTDSVDTVVFNLHQIKQRNFFGTPDSHVSSTCIIIGPFGMWWLLRV